MNAFADRLSQGVYSLKPGFQDLLRPVARALANTGVRANHITIAATFASAAVGIFVSAYAARPRVFLLLPFFLLLRMALNALDGMLAREFDQQSRVGLYLNELGDVISDAFCLVPFMLVASLGPLWIGAIVILAGISETAGILGPMVRAKRRYDGPMGKSDRALVFAMLAAWIGVGGIVSASVGPIFSVAMVILLSATIANRVRGGLAEAEDIAIPAVTAPPPHTRYVQHRYFETHDGARLFYRYWPALDGKSDRAIVLLHRGHEHSGRLAHVVDELNLPEFSTFAWDARGHGHSATPSSVEPTLGTFVKDLDSFVAHVSHAYGIPTENIAVVSQSVGSVLTATWVHDYAPHIRCMVLVAPAFKVKLYVPFAKTFLRWMHRIIGDFHVKSYVRPSVLTHDPERIASYKADPFITRPISVRVLLGLYGTSDRVVRDAQAIHVPTQVLISGRDWVVHNAPQEDFFERLGSETKEKHVFANFFHDILGENDRRLAIEKVRGFITYSFATEPKLPDLRDADRHGVTKEEFDALRRPMSALSPKGLAYAVTRFGMKTGGRVSGGIRVGLKTGFDSGASLDYVYRNRATGLWPLGLLIDRLYLDSAGWSGIRTRKENMVRALRYAMSKLRANNMPIRILDVAAGQGRYVLDALEQNSDRVEDVLLHDYAEQNVRAGLQLVNERKLESLVRFEKGDAFDRASLQFITPLRTLGIVSGLYELFPENDGVRTSIAGLADAIAPGGYLVYTCQPFHPQLELIARTLPNREQRPWIMRRRTQAEMDQLVSDAGFRKVEQWIDDDGIFSVSVAERIG